MPLSTSPAPIERPALRLLFLAAGLLLAGSLSGAEQAAARSGEGLWLHVAVDEGGPAGSRVRVTVPLSLAQAILPLIDDEEIAGGKIRLDHLGDGAENDRAEIRALRAAVAAAPEGEFVPVAVDDQTALAARSGKNLLLRIDEEDMRVRIRFPLDLVDALLAAEAAGHGELGLAATISTLAAAGPGDIVAVDDGHDQVRIWLDAKPEHE
jgi:hypothetical protein